jgi:hypothetical protein
VNTKTLCGLAVLLEVSVDLRSLFCKMRVSKAMCSLIRTNSEYLLAQRQAARVLSVHLNGNHVSSQSADS